MKQVVLVGTLVAALAGGVAVAQTSPKATGTSGTMLLGTVHLPREVLADGKPLPAGTYQVRLTNEEPKPAVGEDPSSEKYVEFMRAGKVAGREVATVIGPADIGKIAKGKKPRTNSSSVEMLKGGDYLRVWINKGGTNYLINMPPEGKGKG
jgi:hypothetical protein